VRLSPRHAAVALALWALAAASPGRGQFPTGTTGIEAELPDLRAKAPPRLPSLVLRADGAAAVPGPLAGEGPRLHDGRLGLRVAGGLALAPAAPGQDVVLAPDPGPLVSDLWVERADGLMRFRFEPSGRLVAERRAARGAADWKRRWRLRVGGKAVAPPVVLGSRVCFGTLENRVYCVQSRNGHRLWAADVGGRVSSSLAAWTGRVEPESPGEAATSPVDVEALLVVPDGGAELVALAALSGQKLAGMQVTAHGDRLVGAPVVLPDGRVAVARQGYRPDQATIDIYRLFLAPPPPVPGPAAAAGATSAPRSAPGPP